MQLGDIFLFKDYAFHDGETADKLFVVLNTPRAHEKYVIIITTSNKENKNMSYGCHHNELPGYFTILANQSPFNKNTFLLIRGIKEIDFNTIKKNINSGKIYKFAKLSKDIMEDIVNCIESSDDVQWGIIEKII